MFDYQKEITDLFIKNEFLFTKNDITLSEYIEHFFPKGHYPFRVPFFVDTFSFLKDYRKNIVQTYQTISDSTLIVSSLFQITRDEHLTIGYTAIHDKMCASVSVHVYDATKIPGWLKTMKAYEIEEESLKKTVGFGQHT
jgi:hypothetical protein